MERTSRTEQEIFNELAVLCQSPGYIHTIAWLCIRDNTVGYAEELKPEDIVAQSSPSALIRTEIATLIGLALKGELDFTTPSSEELEQQVAKTEALLSELHQSMLPHPDEIFDPTKLNQPNFDPMSDGRILREAIFYAAESAYFFQYLELSKQKYVKDNDWLIRVKGYSVEDAHQVIQSLYVVQSRRLNELIEKIGPASSDDFSFLEAFTFNIDDVSAESGISPEKVELVLGSFVHHLGMGDFNSLDDFNPAKAYPLVRLDEQQFLLLQHYTLLEAFYETPFFWFRADEEYLDDAMYHRGLFAEEFSKQRLASVFGDERVHQGVNIINSKGGVVGEIDVLVVFADRAIVLQAKSKKLTIQARKGNDLAIEADFKKAVQDAYDQAFECGCFLIDPEYRLIDQEGVELAIHRDLKEIYPVCVVSDHYPALSYQARQFINLQSHDVIKPAFVMDVFFLDVMIEMLDRPLHLLSYVNRRTLYNERLLTEELTALSFHLRQNLWIDEKMSMMQLSDDISADLDSAMLSRRAGLPGNKTPEGLLTKYTGTHYDNLIREIDNKEHPATVALGFELLQLSGEAIELFNDGISEILRLSRGDGQHHDFAIGLDVDTGITVHCNDDDPIKAMSRLQRLIELRKYKQKANKWYGLCLDIRDGKIRFGINADFEWRESEELNRACEFLQDIPDLKGNKLRFTKKRQKKMKIGRNEKCPCGSGKKYKKCCLQ